MTCSLMTFKTLIWRHGTCEANQGAAGIDARRSSGSRRSWQQPVQTLEPHELRQHVSAAGEGRVDPKKSGGVRILGIRAGLRRHVKMWLSQFALAEWFSPLS